MSLINEITPEVLELHRKYRNGEPGGVRLVTVVGAVKISADLRGADHPGAVKASQKHAEIEAAMKELEDMLP